MILPVGRPTVRLVVGVRGVIVDRPLRIRKRVSGVVPDQRTDQ